MRHLIAAVAVGLLVSACGGGGGGTTSTSGTGSGSSSGGGCATFMSAAAQVGAEGTPCLDAGFSYNDAGPTLAGCQSAYTGGCSSADQSALNGLFSSFGSCVNGLGNCAPASAESWALSYIGCALPLLNAVSANGDAGVSATCGAALEDAGF